MAARSVWRPNVRQLRLATGLTIFAYVATHLLNHSLGIVSLAAMEQGLVLNQLLWTGWLGSTALYGAFLIHMSLGIWALYERRWFRVRPAEVTQLLLGLTIPLLLLGHIIGSRYAFAVFDRIPRYENILLLFWHFVPLLGVKQVALLTVAWGHGCIGLYFWLRLKPGFSKWSPTLLTAAVLLPCLALIGFANGGREVARLAADPDFLAAVAERAGSLSRQEQESLDQLHDLTRLIFLGLIGAAIAARGVRSLYERRSGAVLMTYADGRTVRLPKGRSVLDGSRLAGIPHASVCGGRGRCSTCRVRILHGLSDLPARSEAEQTVLSRLDADPSTRLACQLRPTHDLSVALLMKPDAAVRRPGGSGRERAVAILFTDIRGSTPIVEKRLPYDIVFLLNRFFETIGSAVIEVGGFPNQFIGDSVMALFGIETDMKTGSRQALDAARNMAVKLEQMNKVMADDLPQPIRIGIGVHAGSAIIGEMGYAGTVTTTAVGDPVHVAARLQELTKTYGCQLIVSEVVAEAADIDLSAFQREEIKVRGREQPLGIRIIPKATDLILPPAPA